MPILMRNKLVLMSLCLISMGLTGCVNSLITNETSVPSLNGSTWRLLSLAGLGHSPIVATTLRFEDKFTLRGFDGCNSYRGSYRSVGSTLQLSSEIMSTMAACPEPVERQARAFKKALQGTISFVTDNKILQLQDSNAQVIAIFEAASLTLAGTSWDVVAYNNAKQAVVSVLLNSHINVLFGNDDQLAGNAGCNRYFASYQETSGYIVIGQPAATRRFCAEQEAIMQQEQDYLAALQSGQRFQLDGDRLTLRTQEGAIAVSLLRSPANRQPSKQ
jgi:heat shock protein HslJ